jgi:hypothetical protein
MMIRRLIPRACALAFLLTGPGCITVDTAECLTKPTTTKVDYRPDALVSVHDVSVAVVESRLSLVVAFERGGGGLSFWAAPLAGRDAETPTRGLAPVALASLPDSVVPIRFTNRGEGFTGHDADWWRLTEVGRHLQWWPTGENTWGKIQDSDLAEAALVSHERREEGRTWRFWVSLPDGRKLVATPEGVVPEIDERDAAPIELVQEKDPVLARHECGRARTAALVPLLPLTLAADVALSPFELLLVFVPIGC